MAEINHCPICHCDRPIDAPAGLCPACLLKAGMTTDDVEPKTQAGSKPFAVPTAEVLAPLFPQLEVLELIGQGGMGAVYKARQPVLDRFVALKILPHRDDVAFAERFVREARALAKLSHPGIVTVHDFGQVGGLYYLIMEFVEGVNLRQAQQAGKLKPDEALAIVPKICEALQFAHDSGIVHRDIKPENILLDGKGRVKIADFGLAKLLNHASDQSQLTGNQQVMGTLHYMAPEQWEKPLDVDHRADIYSLGVVFYELLTGELPLGRFAPPSQKVQVDVRLDDVVLRALEKEPQRRYQHASDVKTDVEKITSEMVDKLTMEEVKAAIDQVPQRIAELKAARDRLSQRHFALWFEEYRRKHPERFQPWSRKKRICLMVLITLIICFVFFASVMAVIESDAPLNFINAKLVYAAAWPILVLDALLIWNRPKKPANRIGSQTKVGCWFAFVFALAFLVLQVWGAVSKDPTIELVASYSLLMMIGGPFLWRLASFVLSRLRPAEKSNK